MRELCVGQDAEADIERLLNELQQLLVGISIMQVLSQPWLYHMHVADGCNEASGSVFMGG